MHFDITTKTIHEVIVTNLECIPPDNKDAWEGYELIAVPLADPSLFERDADDDRELTDAEIAFEAEWLTEATRTAIDALPLYDQIENERFYLGHWNSKGSENKMVVVQEVERDNYGRDVTYNGWRVTISAKEVDWGLD